MTTERAAGHKAWGAARRSAVVDSQSMSPCWPAARKAWKRALVEGSSAAGAKPTASNPSSSALSRIAWLVPLTGGSAATPIGCDALIGQPKARRRRAGLIEDVDRH